MQALLSRALLVLMSFLSCGLTTAGIPEMYLGFLALDNNYFVFTSAIFVMIQDCSGTMSPRPSEILEVPTAKC